MEESTWRLIWDGRVERVDFRSRPIVPHQKSLLKTSLCPTRSDRSDRWRVSTEVGERWVPGAVDGSLGAFGHAVTIGGLSFQHRGVWVVGMTPPDYMYFPSNNNPLGWFIEGIPRAKADSSDIFYPKEHHIHEQRDTTHLPLRHLEKIGALHWRSTQQLSFLYRRMGRFGKLLMPRPPPFPRD